MTAINIHFSDLYFKIGIHICFTKFILIAIFGSQQYVKPRFTIKMNVSTSNSLETLYMCVKTPQNRAHFSKTINLRSQMPRFAPEMNIFPSTFLETP